MKIKTVTVGQKYFAHHTQQTYTIIKVNGSKVVMVNKQGQKFNQTVECLKNKNGFRQVK